MLDVLFWGLKASPVACASYMETWGKQNCNFYIKKNIWFFPAVNFFKFLVIKTLDSEMDPDPQLGKMLDPDPDPH